MKPRFEATDDAERKVMECEDLDEGVKRDDSYANPSDVCDICYVPLSDKRFMIDGNIQPGGCMWACMCASCFLKKGEGIRYGAGQLYTQMESGEWLMTSGFGPEE